MGDSAQLYRTVAFVAGNLLAVYTLALFSTTPKIIAQPAPTSPLGDNPPSDKKSNASEEKIVVGDDVEDGCNTCAKSLVDSVKHIDMHLVICMPQTWIKRVESEEGSFIHILDKAISDTIKGNHLSLKVKLTACDRENSTPELVDIISYPQKCMYRLQKNAPSNDIHSFVRSILLGEKLEESIVVLKEELPWERLVLICSHASRDKRCGRAGPILINEFNKQLTSHTSSNKVAVFGSSHIGGHEFAGTLIVYPEGKCFGYVTKNKVSVLLDYIANGNAESFDSISPGCYRGQYNESW